MDKFNIHIFLQYFIMVLSYELWRQTLITPPSFPGNNMPESLVRAQRLSGRKVTFYNADLCSKESLMSVMSKVSRKNVLQHNSNLIPSYLDWSEHDSNMRKKRKSFEPGNKYLLYCSITAIRLMANALCTHFNLSLHHWVQFARKIMIDFQQVESLLSS